MVPDKALLIILDIKSDMYMAKNGKDNKHRRQLAKRIHFVKNGTNCNFCKKVWCEEGLQLKYIGTKNVIEDELNSLLGYTMVRIYY